MNALAAPPIDPRIGTAAFMLMILLSRASRRREAREAQAAQLPPERPSP
jgi:hypothetical protein